ncbi:MAG: hypothetical protein V9F04_04740, partial [Dermatophilaceae bacterium]
PDSPGGLSTFTRGQSRMSTAAGRPMDRVEITPEDRAASEVDEALARSQQCGGFLALRVPKNRLTSAQRGLARFQTGENGLTTINLEATFMAALHAEAQRRGVNWDNLVAADDVDGSHWVKLEALARPAVEATIVEVTRHAARVWHGSPGRSYATAPRRRLPRSTACARRPIPPTPTFGCSGWWSSAAPPRPAPPSTVSPCRCRPTTSGSTSPNTWLTNAHRAGASQAS